MMTNKKLKLSDEIFNLGLIILMMIMMMKIYVSVDFPRNIFFKGANP